MTGLHAHLPVLPVVLPLLAASALLVLHRAPLVWKRALSLASTLLLAWACGSRSTRSTRCPAAARKTARLTDVVVLPTPPF